MTHTDAAVRRNGPEPYPDEMRRSRTVQASLTPGEFAALRSDALEHRMSVSTYVREVLRRNAAIEAPDPAAD